MSEDLAIIKLYQEVVVEDFGIDYGDLSLEVFEVQYWNKYDGDEDFIRTAIELDYECYYE